ncbi:McrC family protein [Sulfurimonas sp. SAG-AH-194-C20]|nr:McrC family protein [Sulfurimonas sp. SAG-AH-194-C20]MDF1878814.1 McrC family protein [Sulfurimonas sp. SAG-AH-194-C20]
MSKQIILKEYEFLQTKYETSEHEKAHYINERIFDELESFVLQNDAHVNYLKLTTKKGFGKVLQAQNYVGLIQTNDGTTIEILPKVKNINSDEESKKILIKMLCTLKKSPFKHFNKVNLKSSKMPLLEIFISMFLEELAKLIQKGIKSDYILKEENLHFLKGKLKISEQIKQNSIHKERFFVEYEEFSSDRAENRLIKSTLEYLYKKSKYNKNQQKIREFLFVFDEVSLSKDIKTDFSKIKCDRQMKDYEDILLWAKTFLLENSFSPYSGESIAFALLFDMNLLFESYVGAYLKKKGFDVKVQDKGKYLVQVPSKYSLRPDFVLNKDTENEIIADTKYKNISKQQDISQADMYQLYAYGTKYKMSKQLYLIYPKGDDVALQRYAYIENELHLDVLFFDLSLGFNQELFVQTRCEISV